MRIQDVEQQCGMDRATIRFYEKEGLISPDREENGYRSYSDGDLQLLHKIKLLRRLGVSLQTIQALQQGSEDFSVILQQQIEMLENKISEDTAAKNVCVEMQRNMVDYNTLDTQKYLRMLDDRADKSNEFNEEVIREHHPWRRYFARTLDIGLISALIDVFVVLILGIRPFSEGLQLLLKYGAYFLAVPIFAFCISKWGTTPGKWIMGIRLESIDGGNLDFETAFSREKSLLWYGFGLFLPFYEIWRLYKSYKKDTEGERNEWNSDSEIVYTDWTVIKKVGIGTAVAVTLLLNAITVFNAVLPPNRYREMTVAQFAQNYNTYIDIFDNDSYLILDSSGKWTEIQTDGVRVSVGQDFDYVRPEFQFTLEGNTVKAVQYTETWVNESYINVIPNYCAIAMYTMVGSRPGADYSDIRQLDTLLKDIQISVEKGNNRGEKKISDIVFKWDLQLVNWDYIQDGTLISFNQNATYKLNIEMLIQVD